jgi:hypothetical protein
MDNFDYAEFIEDENKKKKRRNRYKREDAYRKSSIKKWAKTYRKVHNTKDN